MLTTPSMVVDVLSHDKYAIACLGFSNGDSDRLLLSATHDSEVDGLSRQGVLFEVG